MLLLLLPDVCDLLSRAAANVDIAAEPPVRACRVSFDIYLQFLHALIFMVTVLEFFEGIRNSRVQIGL